MGIVRELVLLVSDLNAACLMELIVYRRAVDALDVLDFFLLVFLSLLPISCASGFNSSTLSWSC